MIFGSLKICVSEFFIVSFDWLLLKMKLYLLIKFVDINVGLCMCCIDMNKEK